MPDNVASRERVLDLQSMTWPGVGAFPPGKLAKDANQMSPPPRHSQGQFGVGGGEKVVLGGMCLENSSGGDGKMNRRWRTGRSLGGFRDGGEILGSQETAFSNSWELHCNRDGELYPLSSLVSKSWIVREEMSSAERLHFLASLSARDGQ